MNRIRSLVCGGAALAMLAVAGLPSAYGQEDIPMCGNEPPKIPGQPQRLLFWQSSTPEIIDRAITLTGLLSGDVIVSMDFNTTIGQLVGVGQSGMMYTMDYKTGRCQSTGRRVPNPPTAGGSGGTMDFLQLVCPCSDPCTCPTVDICWWLKICPCPGDPHPEWVEFDRDRITEIVSGPGLQYARGDIHAGRVPSIVSVAADQLNPEPSPWRLYGLDSSTDSLVMIDGKTGVVSTVGRLGDPIDGSPVGFDIVQSAGRAPRSYAYAAWHIPGPDIYCFYAIDLFTGVARAVGRIGGAVAGPPIHVYDIAALPVEQTCAADLNGDGLVDFSDYLAFLNFYEAGDRRVDFTGDGLVDFSDYLEFLNLFDAGC